MVRSGALARAQMEEESVLTERESCTYERLAAPFDQTFRDTRGGVDLEYITGEQCATRLNEILGPGGWSYRVLQQDIHVEADEAWVLGELTAELDGKTVARQQFGSQKIKRSRSSGMPIDIGFDLKGAATDAMKKCASLIGVGLYLSRKEPWDATAAAAAAAERQTLAMADGRTAATDEVARCEDCGTLLTETRFRDGTAWPPAQLAGYGRRKHGRVLCMEHYRAANEARKAQLLGSVPA